ENTNAFGKCSRRCQQNSRHWVDCEQFIPEGTCTWRFQPGFDLLLNEEQLQSLSAPARQQVRYYAFYDSEKSVYVLSGDDDRFTNHSDEPNIQNIYTGGILKRPPSATSRLGKRSRGITGAG
ncbi:MAG: hypothetical protein ABI977_02260, partial [Acidobacteriota bacterium]